MKRRILAVATVVALLASGCSGGTHHTAAPTTVPDAPTTTLPNPDVIPPVITPAYVNAVFKVLNHINGNAIRDSVSARRLTASAQQDLRAIYNGPLFSQEITIVRQSLGASLVNVRKPPGDRLTVVRRLIAGTNGCIFVETSTDYSAVLVHVPPAAASEYYSLAPKQPVDDPLHVNPTPWAISFNATYVGPTSIPDQCAAA